MTQIKNKFWRRFSGNVNFGYNYTKSTKISQGSFNGMLEYRPRDYLLKLSGSALISGESGIQVSRKDNIDLTGLRYLKKRWFVIGMTSFQQNTEMGLDLRIQGILGYGNELIHTKSNQLLSSLGMSVNQERSADSTANTVNAEGVLSTYYKLFIISIPKVSITSSLMIYPSFTVKGRWRLSYELQATTEIISNLNFSITFDYNFDNKPLTATSSNTDMNISTTLGYSFY